MICASAWPGARSALGRHCGGHGAVRSRCRSRPDKFALRDRLLCSAVARRSRVLPWLSELALHAQHPLARRRGPPVAIASASSRTSAVMASAAHQLHHESQTRNRLPRSGCSGAARSCGRVHRGVGAGPADRAPPGSAHRNAHHDGRAGAVAPVRHLRQAGRRLTGHFSHRPRERPLPGLFSTCYGPVAIGAAGHRKATTGATALGTGAAGAGTGGACTDGSTHHWCGPALAKACRASLWRRHFSRFQCFFFPGWRWGRW